MCVHDRRINRTSNGRGAVSALELSDLAALDFGSWKTRDAAGGPRVEEPDWEHRPEDREATSVLTLERLLELVADAGRRVELAIETKHPTRWAGQVEERLLVLLKRFGLDAPASREDSPVRVMSFSARSLHRVRAASPTLPTVYLMQFVTPRLRDGRLPEGADIAGPSIRILRSHPGYIERLKRTGRQVHVWTVNEPRTSTCASASAWTPSSPTGRARYWTVSGAELAGGRLKTHPYTLAGRHIRPVCPSSYPPAS